MPVAARIGDPLLHSNAMVGLLEGLAVGLVIGMVIVCTGGAAAAVMAAGATAAAAGGSAALATAGAAAIAGATVVSVGVGGAGMGSMLGSLSTSGGTITGMIASGSVDVLIDGLPATRAFAGLGDEVQCDGVPPLYLPPSHHGKLIAQGSASVLINGEPAARVGDQIECGAQIQSGSMSVLIEGGQVTTLEIASEVPMEVNIALMVIGLGSAIILVGPVVAILGAAGGVLGGVAGGAIADKWAPGNRDAKIQWGFVGGLIGGILAGQGAKLLATKLGARTPGFLGKFIEGGLTKVYAKPVVPTEAQAREDYNGFMEEADRMDFEPAPQKNSKGPGFFTGRTNNKVGMGDVARAEGYLTVNTSPGGIRAGFLDGTIMKILTWDVFKAVWVKASERYATYVGELYGSLDPVTGAERLGVYADRVITVFLSQEYADNPHMLRGSIFWNTERPILFKYGVLIEYVIVEEYKLPSKGILGMLGAFG